MKTELNIRALKFSIFPLIGLTRKARGKELSRFSLFFLDWQLAYSSIINAARLTKVNNQKFKKSHNNELKIIKLKQASLTGRPTILEQKRSFWPRVGPVRPQYGPQFFLRFQLY